MNNKLVTAVITTHNRLGPLKKSIESVLAQSYQNVECIVVSDNSSDGTNEYCSSRNDITFISIPKEESRGGNYARNLGIKAAKGEYIAFLDDDDWWMPNKISEQMSLIEKKNCSVAYCLREFHKIHESGSESIYNESKLHRIQGNIKKAIFRRFITSTSCLLVKKEALYEVGLFDEHLRKWQEYDLMIRLAQRYDIYYVEDCLCCYLIDDQKKDRISADLSRISSTVEYFREKYVAELKQNSVYNRYCFEYTVLCEYGTPIKSFSLINKFKFLPLYVANIIGKAYYKIVES